MHATGIKKRKLYTLKAFEKKNIKYEKNIYVYYVIYVYADDF